MLKIYSKEDVRCHADAQLREKFTISLCHEQCAPVDMPYNFTKILQMTGILRVEEASGQLYGQVTLSKSSHASRILCFRGKDTWMLMAISQLIVIQMFISVACVTASSSNDYAGTTTTTANLTGTLTNRTRIRVICGLRPALPSYYEAVEDWVYDALQPGADADIALVEIVPEAAAATDPRINSSIHILSASEAAMQPLLSANISWLRNLEEAAAAGMPLPPSYTTPRPGTIGGPTMAPLLLFYRRDWWEAVTGIVYNKARAAIPPTWPRLVALLEQLHQLDLDLDGDGASEHVLCVDMTSGCKGWSLLAGIFASMIQTHGTSGGGGLWFNPAMSMRNRIGGAAMARALQLYGSLAAVNAREFTPVSVGHVTRSDQGAGLAAELLRSTGAAAAAAAAGPPSCTAVNPLFASGRCLFTVDWATAALHLDRSSAAATAGRIGVALLPGSTVVQDETAPHALTTCTAATCSRAELFQETTLPPAPSPPPSADQKVNGTAIPVTIYTRLRAATEQTGGDGGGGGDAVSSVSQQLPVFRVNRVPLLGEVTNTWLLPNPDPSGKVRNETEAFMSRVGFQLGLMYGMMFTATFQSNASETSSYLMAADSTSCDASASTSLGSDLTHLVVPTGTATAAAALGILNMDPEDVREVVQTASIALTSSNRAYDIMMPYSYMYRTVLDNMTLEALEAHGFTAFAAAAATAASSRRGAAASDDLASASSATLASVTSPLEATSGVSEPGTVPPPWSTLAANGSARFQAVFERFPYPNILKQAYLHAFPPAVENVTVVQEKSKSRSVLLHLGLPLIISSGCTVLALSVATVVIWWMLRNRRLKAVRPPGPGPATTLVVSDIQNSTLLWEVLPSGVMDLCLGIHHSIIRKHLAETRGYELSTEGDAFAVAFHCPSDALAFAMDTQVALLHADWPPSLLEQADGCELWVQPLADPANGLETGGSQEFGPLTGGSPAAWWRENSDAAARPSTMRLGSGGATTAIAVRPLPSRVGQLRSEGTQASGTSDGGSCSVGGEVAAVGVRPVGSVLGEGGRTLHEVNGSAASAAVRLPPGIVAVRLAGDGGDIATPLALPPIDTAKNAATAADGDGDHDHDDGGGGGGGRIRATSAAGEVSEDYKVAAAAGGDADHDSHHSDWRRMVTWDAGLAPHHSHLTISTRGKSAVAAAAPSTPSPRPGLHRPPPIKTSMSLDRRVRGALEAKLPYNHNNGNPSDIRA
ncbi:hypothetical protein Vretimale_9750, partial [Volvox reticuliferus]